MVKRPLGGDGDDRTVVHPQFQLRTGRHFEGLPDMDCIASFSSFLPPPISPEHCREKSQHLTGLRLGRCFPRTSQREDDADRNDRVPAPHGFRQRQARDRMRTNRKPQGGADTGFRQRGTGSRAVIMVDCYIEYMAPPEDIRPAREPG